MISNVSLSSLQRLYREKGENMKHNYTLSGDLPEMVQAKLNAANLSDVRTTLTRSHTETHEIHQTANQSIQSAAFACVRFSTLSGSEFIHLLCAFSELLQGILD